MGVYDVMTGSTLWQALPKESQVLAHRQAHGISAWSGTWAGLSGTRLTPRSCGALMHLYDSWLLDMWFVSPVMGLVCDCVIAYLLGCPWQIVPCGCVTLGWLDDSMLPLSCGLIVDCFIPVALVLLLLFLVQLGSKAIRIRCIYYYSSFSSTELSSLVLAATKSL